MKTLVFLLSSFVAFSINAQSQYSSLYSAGNYKMPHHAKVAREKNLDKYQTLEYKTEEVTGNQLASNYKNSFAKPKVDGGQFPVVPMETVSNALASESNYKSSFKGTSNKKAKLEQVPAQPPVIEIISKK